MSRSIRLWLLPFAFLAISPAPAPAGIPGVYMIAICTGPCTVGDTVNVSIGGRLVLLPDSLTLEDIPEQYRWRYAEGTYFMDLEGPTNGCFALRPFPQNRTFAGIAPIGLTHWKRRAGPDSVTFCLYRSPDAFYFVAGHLENGNFRGTGISHLAGLDSTLQSEPDSVFAIRLGDAEACACWPSAWKPSR